MIVGGDFNCVLNPKEDRIVKGKPGEGSSECPELGRTVTGLNIVDASDVLKAKDPPLLAAPTEHFTYWRERSASRIDRFYVSAEIAPEVQWLAARLPPQQSDHQEIRLELSKGSHRQQRARAPCVYPVRTDKPRLVSSHIAARLEDCADPQTARNWDEFARKSAQIITQTVRKDKKRRRDKKRQMLRLQSEISRSRGNLLKLAVQSSAWNNAVSRGRFQEDDQSYVKKLYKRTSQWSSDQTISFLSPSAGGQFCHSMPIEEQMAKEWDPILGQTHRRTNLKQIRSELKSYACIPDERLVSDEDNEALMSQITEAEMYKAVRSLSRDKGGGLDGLNNDFFKDFAPELIPKLLPVLNDILNGAEPPKTFLEALVIPLRKKGDSSNAMDYRPIMLLATSYKLLSKVLATRLQKFLHKLIGSQQQGFVRGRQLRHAVTLMMAQLDDTFHDPDVGIDDAPAILLLDFFKAYDTLDREYLLELLVQYNFSPRFVSLIARIHTGTTAKFSVNGRLSKPHPVKSGIRQGCPLAPLLFLLGVEPLSLAIKRHFELLKGQEKTQQNAESLKCQSMQPPKAGLSAFVDDTAIAIPAGRTLPGVLRCVQRFGDLSGLRAQPEKSNYICLNSAVHQKAHHGVPFVEPGSTVRYLGVELGTGEKQTINWSRRLTAITVRLALAAKLKLSVIDKVTLLNTIMLPSILFTASFIPPPASILTKLKNIQKNFLWKGSLETSGSRHKINPALVFTPKEAGGLGLIDIGIALRLQSIKHATEWLNSPPSRFTNAWHYLRSKDQTQTTNMSISPQHPAPKRNAKSAAAQGWIDIQQDLALQDPRPLEWKEQHCLDWLSHRASLKWWIEEKSRLHISLEHAPHNLWHWDDVWRAYWPSFQWGDNAWMLTAALKPLTMQKHRTLANCKISKLDMRRHSSTHFSILIPREQGRRSRHKNLVDWGLTLTLNVPEISIGAKLQIPNMVNQISEKTSADSIRWKIQEKNVVMREITRASHVEKELWFQQDNKITWISANNRPKEKDSNKVVLTAHPTYSPVPWIEPPSRKMVTQATIARSRSRRQRRDQEKAITKLSQRLKSLTVDSSWHRLLLSQTPTEIWQRKGLVTRYHVWFYARMVTNQLNLFYEGKNNPSKCELHLKCESDKETIEHIVWQCETAQSVWKHCWARCTRNPSSYVTQEMEKLVATRQPPPLSVDLRTLIEAHYGFLTSSHLSAYQTFWWILSTVIPAELWLHRNDIIFRNANNQDPATTERIWCKALSICEAAASTQRARADSAVAGMGMLQLLPLLRDPATMCGPVARHQHLLLHFDGGARGNPGPGGSGWCISSKAHDETVWTLLAFGYRYNGDSTTNNQSEAIALRDGLAYLARTQNRQTTILRIIGDSNLLIQTFKGKQTISAPSLIPIIQDITELSQRYASIDWKHTRRAQNTAADYLANLAMDSKATGTLQSNLTATSSSRIAEVMRHLRHDHTSTHAAQPIAFIERLQLYAESIR